MEDIYEPPKSDLSQGEVYEKGKRPGWVWVISIWYMLSALISPLSVYLVLTGFVPLNAAQRLYYDNLGIVGYMIFLIGVGLTFGAGLSLFLLRKVTINIWLALIVFGVLSHIYNLAANNWIAAVGTGGIIGAVISLVIAIAVYLYTRRLEARGILS